MVPIGNVMVPAALFDEQIKKQVGPRLFKGVAVLSAERNGPDDPWVLCLLRCSEFRLASEDEPTPTYEFEFDGTTTTWKEIR